MEQIKEGELAHVCLKKSFYGWSERMGEVFREDRRKREQYQQRDQGKTSSWCDQALAMISIHT